MRISDWSSDVCSSDLKARKGGSRRGQGNIAQSARALSHFAQRGAHFGQGMGNGAMIAVKSLQRTFWVLMVTLGAIAVYFVSLGVATERQGLECVYEQILAAQRELRDLEQELSARAHDGARTSVGDNTI